MMSSDDHDKTRKKSHVTFVTHERFTDLFFPPSCCVNALLPLSKAANNLFTFKNKFS